MVNSKIKVENLNIYYSDREAVRNLNIEIAENEILGIIGPSNSGKTSFLKTLNRLNDLQDGFRYDGKILLDGKDVYKEIDIQLLRKRVGIVFALPLPLPLSILQPAP